MDATCGSGHDTLFLCQHTLKKVWSFDVQAQALTYAKSTIEKVKPVVQWVHDGHENMAKWVTSPLDMAMFNFGYWPKGDPDFTSQASTSLQAVQSTCAHMSPNGRITVLLYPGHDEGKKETKLLQSFFMTLSETTWTIQKIQSHQPTATTPELWLLEKQATS
jgi:hypothetical protein